MIWEPIKRWLYRGNRPGRVASWLNRGWVALQARGVGPQNLVTLEVVGHRSGRLISLPLMIASIDGERYVASMLGADAAWVRNVKAADGYAVLRHESAEKVRLAYQEDGYYNCQVIPVIQSVDEDRKRLTYFI